MVNGENEEGDAKEEGNGSAEGGGGTEACLALAYPFGSTNV